MKINRAIYLALSAFLLIPLLLYCKKGTVPTVTPEPIIATDSIIMPSPYIAPILFNPNLTYGTMTDQDGNIYKTIEIGTQTWMAENLRTTKFSNGVPIPNVSDAKQWSESASAAYSNYENNSNNANTYGRLYNWFAVNNSINIAPAGWHIPDKTEWLTLISFLGESGAGSKLKEADTIHWNFPNTGATNESGFTALPGGGRSGDYRIQMGKYYSIFDGKGKGGIWWSATESVDAKSWCCFVALNSPIMRGSEATWHGGCSVRCIKDTEYSPDKLPVITTAILMSSTETTATCGGSIAGNSGTSITVRGVCWSTTPHPTTDNSKTNDGTGVGSFKSGISGLETNTTYYLRAFASNTTGTGYGSEVAFKTAGSPVSDVDGNIYHPVTIGTQTWMVENLKTTKFRNGESIPNITDGPTWGNLKTAAYCNYNSDANLANIYGRLYNGYCVSDSRNLAPTGWHVPSDAEWWTLTDYLGSESVAGGKLKEIGTTHWNAPNTGATNEAGFSALPAGTCFQYGGQFSGIGDYCVWWTATASDVYSGYEREVDSINSAVHDSGGGYWGNGLSVRCIKD